MTATTVYANWTSVGFTPSGGSLTNITRVDSIDVRPGATLVGYAGDNNRYNIGLFNLMNDPKVTVNTSNIGTIVTFVPGTPGVLVATLNDAKNGNGTGSFALLFTFNNAVVEDAPLNDRHAQLATGSISFRQFSSDGTTNPTAVTVQ